MRKFQVPQTERELLDNAARLTGKSLQQVAGRLAVQVPDNQKTAKGWTGELLEIWLGATASSRPLPDFPQLGIELKTLPIDDKGRPAESTHVCSVAMNGSIGSSWEQSTVRSKLARVLWVPIEASRSVALAERRIGRPFIWSPDRHEEADLRSDWQEHMDMINSGEIDRITARQGKYLQIRPKAANARALTQTTRDSGEPAMTLPRAFYLRSLFTHYLIHKYGAA